MKAKRIKRYLTWMCE